MNSCVSSPFDSSEIDETIRQLKRENESLKACIKELEAKLAMYEDAHTPPSLKRGGKRKKGRNSGPRKKYWFHHTVRDFYCDPEE